MSFKYLHFSVFIDSVQRHGGTKRSQQLVEVLSGEGVESYNPVKTLKDSIKFSIKHPFLLLQSVLFAIYLFLFKGANLKGTIKFALLASYPLFLLNKYQPETVFHETAPGFTLMFMQYLRWKKIKYIAIPHNIEFMVPNQTPSGFRNIAAAFACEVEGYKAATGIRVICDYDKTILACLGINSSVFSYYPINEDLEAFSAVFEFRSQQVFEKTYLALGTVGNKPTFDGVKALLDFKKQNINDFNLVLAGYGTEQFSDYQSDTVSVLGGVNTETLDDLLKNSKALLINQPQTTGFLTKIVEFNLCGIPMLVLSDYAQAKNLQDYGVYCVSINEIDKLEVQPPSRFFEKPFVSELML